MPDTTGGCAGRRADLEHARRGRPPGRPRLGHTGSVGPWRRGGCGVGGRPYLRVRRVPRARW